MAFKEAMGILSLVLMVLAYGIYIWQTMREDGVRPHPFSWFLWGFVTGVVYRRHGDTEKSKSQSQRAQRKTKGNCQKSQKLPKNPKWKTKNF